jgi:alanine-glyoxylate transaminase/serine-glyoxylate transaminase/serine-pyruvate transaminase
LRQANERAERRQRESSTMDGTGHAAKTNRPWRAGRHFLHIPGPSPIPDRVLSAMSKQVIDHRGPEFQELGQRVLAQLKTVFKTDGPVIVYPSSGTGAWEAALVNVLSPGDHVLFYETGHFSILWQKLADKLDIKAEVIETDWRRGVDADRIEARLREDTTGSIKAVCVVHNETSTGATSPIADVRKAIDAAGHDALLMVDTISGLCSADYRHQEWGVDVTVSGSQKGLMLPSGLGFNAMSDRALEVHKTVTTKKSYWDWTEMLGPNANGWFPYTPATNLLYGLSEAIDMLHEEGLDNVFARHKRHMAATHAAVGHWGLEFQITEPAHRSPVLTAVRMPDGHSADQLRAVILDTFDMSLGSGLSKIADKVFRIGHLGDLNDLTLIGALSGVEMGLSKAGVPFQKGGVQAAIDHLSATA